MTKELILFWREAMDSRIGTQRRERRMPRVTRPNWNQPRSAGGFVGLAFLVHRFGLLRVRRH
jgi:hypothetical protein